MNVIKNISNETRARRTILNQLVNPTTQNFLLNSGLKKGMKVLDLGCGMGIMSSWIAQEVGPEGQVIAIDNNDELLAIASELANEKGLHNIQFLNMSALDLAELDMTFDFVYSRFLLIHLNKPMSVLEAIYQLLVKNGIFACESAIIGHEFCYPELPAFDRWSELNVELFKSMDKDPQTGKKLHQMLHDVGFQQPHSRLFQHVLNTREERRELLLNDLREQESAYLKAGLCDEAELEELYSQLKEMVKDETYFIAYHQSCQISAVK